MDKNIKKFAFTLAEVLITLGIVGIIAVMTVPAMVKEYRYKIYGTSLKKTYSQISDAVQAIMSDEHSDDFYKTTAGVPSKCATETDSFEKGACYFLRNYFKYAKECKSSEGFSKCIGNAYVTTSGEDAGAMFGSHCIITINGATICMTHNPDDTDTENGSSLIAIDVNGPADPNTIGIDTFIARVKSDGKVEDWSENEDYCNTAYADYWHIGKYAIGCLTKVMKNDWKITE